MPQMQMETPVRSNVFPGSEEAPRTQSRWKANTERLQREVVVVWFVLKNPGTPWYAKIISACVAAYIVSPVQLIPSFIPVIGLMDDFVVLTVGIWLIRVLTPKRVVAEARQRAELALRQGENIRPQAVRVTTIIVALLWLLITIAAFFFIYRRHL